MAMDAQEQGHVLARMSLPAGQQVEHRQPRFLTTRVFALEALLAQRCIFDDDR